MLSNSKNGLISRKWGPFFWYYLIVTLYYWEVFCKNKKKTKSILKLLHCLNFIIVCKTCRESYKHFYQENKILNENNTLYWLWNIKNLINQKIGKSQIEFIKVEEFYIDNSNEKYYWSKKTLSPYYLYSFWIVLYCLALNYPNINEYENNKTLNYSNEYESKKIHTICFIKQMIQLLPYPLSKYKEIIEFTNRQEMFDFIYNWEISINKQSYFGHTKLEVENYFEKNLRVKD